MIYLGECYLCKKPSFVHSLQLNEMNEQDLSWVCNPCKYKNSKTKTDGKINFLTESKKQKYIKK